MSRDALRYVRWPAVVLIASVGIYYAFRFTRLPGRAGEAGLPAVAASAPQASFSGGVEAPWYVLGAPAGATKPREGALNTLYRLAGTFFSYGELNGRQTRSAIIDRLNTGEQQMVEEGGLLDQYQVVSIERDHVVLRSGVVEESLYIAFQDPQQPQQPSEPGEKTDTESVLAQNRFARQIAENRWVLDRTELMAYYDELLDDPERIASIYISLKPDYGENSKIKGYELDMVGEETFFRNMGLLQGDRIRKVNSMNMTSQTRGEYFLKEFVNNRLSAIVVDIERDNVPKKMIYLVR